MAHGVIIITNASLHCDFYISVGDKAQMLRIPRACYVTGCISLAICVALVFH